MAPKKTKQTAVPLPGAKKSKSKPEPPKSKQLSNEFISSSDDSAAEETPSKAKKSEKKKQKEPISIAVHRPKTNGTAKKTEVPVPAAKKSEKKKVVSKKPESSSEEESSDEVMKDKEDAESESESESEVETAKVSKKAAKNDTKKAASSSSSSSEISSSSEEESEEEDEDTPAAPTEQAAPQQTKSHTVEFVAAEPFVPPKGFVAVPTPLDTSSKASKMFENLGGKQIWHITAPAGVSLSQLKEFALDKALAGGAVFSHKGTDYGFSTRDSNEDTPCEVLVPQKKGYKAVPAQISRTLHVQQILNIPNLPAEKQEKEPAWEGFESITKSSVRAPRPQVKGLRMRYFHSGFGDQEEPGTIGMSDSEDEAPAPAQTLSKPEKKRRRSDAGAAEAPMKKKHRTPEELKKREEKKKRKEKKTA